MKDLCENRITEDDFDRTMQQVVGYRQREQRKEMRSSSIAHCAMAVDFSKWL